jgi:hypothetical protein
VVVSLSLALTSRADAFVYWTTGGHDVTDGKVGRADLDGTNVHESFITGNSWGPSVAVDGSHIYWGNWAMVNTIGRSNLDGTGVDQSFIPDVFDPAALAVDSNYIYFGHYATDGISRANINGTGSAGFIGGSNYPYGMAVDGVHVYWSNSLDGTIGRANLNGTSPDQAFITGGNNPHGVAVDSGHVYWANLGAGTIGRANLDGTGVDQSFITGAGFPSGVAVDSGHVYWADNGGGIGRANINGTGVDPTFISLSEYPIAIAVDAGHSVPSTTTLTPSSPSTFYGTPLTLTAGVASADTGQSTATPTGKVAFGVTGEPDVPAALQSGKAVFDPPYYFNVGDSVTARYEGDGTFGVSSDQVSPVIASAATVTRIASSSNPQLVGNKIVIVAAVVNQSTGVVPFGSVEFRVNGIPVLAPLGLDENGLAGIEGTISVPGDYVIQADYVDDTGAIPDFTGSSASLTQRITAPSKAVPVVPLQPPPPPTQTVADARQTPRAPCTVPKLKGLKLKAAKTKLSRAHCKLGKVTRKRAKRARRGRVLSSKPAAGRKTSRGVALVIGK